MKAGWLKIQHTLATIAGSAAGLFDKEGHWVHFID